MSDDYATMHKANGLMNNLSADDVKILHAYVTLLKVSHNGPAAAWRAGNQAVYNALLDRVATVRNEPRQYIQDACEALARSLM